MIAWSLSNYGKLEKTENRETLEDVDSVKIRITRTLLTEDDIALICGEDKNLKLPIIPGRIAIGQVSELAQDSNFLVKGARVFISPIKNCKQCYHCSLSRPHNCYNFSIAGKTANGFLKDFVVTDVQDVYSLPSNVKDCDAIYIEHIALALSVIDKLKIEKGQHIAVIGSGVFASILCQLLIYYQAVPILIDNVEHNLLLAKRTGIYYTIPANINTEKEISTITGGRLASKVVYCPRSDVSLDLAFKLAAPFSTVAFAGFTYPNVKIPLTVAMTKQISTVCITNGYENYLTAINLLANKVLDLSSYILTPTKMDDLIENVETMVKRFETKEPVTDLLINMLG